MEPHAQRNTPQIPSSRQPLNGTGSASGTPCSLTGANGEVVAGDVTVYFNGRDQALRSGGRTRVGRARSSNMTTWQVDPEPVFEDGLYAAVGSVVRVKAASMKSRG